MWETREDVMIVARTVVAMVREAYNAALNAKAEVEAILRSPETPGKQRDAAGHASRNLRDNMSALEEVINRLKLGCDGTQMQMAV